MAEKARGLLSRLVELWPIVTAMIWLIWATSSWHTEVMMQLKTQEDQIKQIQEYLRTDHDHQKGSAETPNSGLSSIQQKPAQGPLESDPGTMGAVNDSLESHYEEEETMNWRVWVYSLVSAAIGGAANSLGGVLVAPSVFNFSHDGMLKIGQLAAFGAGVPVLALLKQTPLPVIQTTTHTLTETTTVNPAPPTPTEIKP